MWTALLQVCQGNLSLLRLLKYIYAMNKLCKIFLSIAASFVVLVSCGPGEISNESWGYVSHIYTVDKHTLRPEFEDTLFRMSNFEEFAHELSTGDRAHILLYYYHDHYSSMAPDWKIVEVIEKIPTLQLASRDEIDLAAYDMPFTGLAYYETSSAYIDPVWLWKDKLNVNAVFRSDADKTEFAMSVKEVKNDTLHMNLLARTTMPSSKDTTKLLTFDLTDIGSMLTADEKASLRVYDKLKFRVHLKYIDNKGTVKDNKFDVLRGEFVNPMK